MLVFNQSCGDKEGGCKKTITFKNMTLKSLYITSSYEYPDTLSFVGVPNPALDFSNTKVLPKETNTNALWGRDCIELAFKDLIRSDTLMVYVFDAQILDSVSWDDVISEYMVLKRYDLSLDDLKQSDFTITYP